LIDLIIYKLIKMDEDYEMFKIVVIGSMGTGKTNISTRYIRNEYNESQKSTVGV
jgi:GTPase SAR1 family protein